MAIKAFKGKLTFGSGHRKECHRSPALYPRQQINLRALWQFLLPGVAVDFAVD